MSERYKDFDSFFEEQERKPLTFKMFGEEHELPPAMPAAIMLKMARLQQEKGKDEDISEDQMASMAVDLLGDKLFEELCSKGLDLEQLEELIKWATEQYTNIGQEEEDGDIKKPVSISSKTGS